MGKCNFREERFKKDDGQAYIVSDWGKKQSDYEIYCKICMSVIGSYIRERFPSYYLTCKRRKTQKNV